MQMQGGDSVGAHQPSAAPTAAARQDTAGQTEKAGSLKASGKASSFHQTSGATLTTRLGLDLFYLLR